MRPSPNAVASVLAVLVGCSEPPDGLVFTNGFGPDFATSVALGADGRFLFGINPSGVSLTESQDPATGDVVIGVSSTSTAGTLVALNSDGTAAWTAGLPAGVDTPVVAPNGTILVDSGHDLYALTPAGKLAWRLVSPGPVSVAPNGLIYQASHTTLRAIAADGSANVPIVSQVEVGGHYFLAPPSIAQDGTLYVATSTYDLGVSALHAVGPGGGVRWTRTFGDTGLRESVDSAVLIGPDGTAWLNTTEGQMLTLHSVLRGFDRDGHEVATLRDRTALAIGADGTIYGIAAAPVWVPLVNGGAIPDGPPVLGAFGRDGVPLWTRRSGVGDLALVAGGGVVFAETESGDLIVGLDHLTLLGSDGTDRARYDMVVNTFSGSPLVRSGFVFQPGMWVNQYPPFNVLASGFRIAGIAPAAGWSRRLGDAGNTRAAGGTTKRVPALGDLGGLWAHQDASGVTALRLGTSEVAYPDLVGVASPYQLWRYGANAAPVLVGRGAADVQGGRLTLTPTWGEGLGQTAKLALGSSDPWSLTLADPKSPDATVTWQLALGFPRPASPNARSGALVKAVADGGAATTFAVDPGSGKVFVAGTYLWDGDVTLGGHPLPHPSGVFHAVLAADAKSYDWTWTDPGASDVPLTQAGFDDAGRPWVTSAVPVPVAGPSGKAAFAKFATWESADAPQPTVSELTLIPPGRITAQGFALRPDGDNSLVGTLDGTVTLGGGAHLSASQPGQSAVFVMRWDASQSLVFAVTLPRSGFIAPSIAYAPDDGLIIAGTSAVTGTAPAPGDPPFNAGEAVWLTALNADGTTRWERTFPGRVDELALAVSPKGDLGLGGTIESSLDLGDEVMTVDDPIPKWLTGDAFIARFDRSGQLRWSRHLRGVERQSVTTIIFDRHDDLVVGGQLGPPIDDDPRAPVVATPIVRAYDACGREAWTQSAEICDVCGAPVTVGGNLRPQALALGPSGDLYLLARPARGVEVDGVIVSPLEFDRGDGTAGEFAVLRLQGSPAAGSEAATCEGVWHELVVEVPGIAGGRVVSDPPGIDCPGTCRVAFEGLAPVTLTATPGPGARFDTWSGACHGSGTCRLVTSTAKAVSARFARPALDAVEFLDGTPERVIGAGPAGPDADAVDDVILVFAPIPGVHDTIGGLTMPQATPSAVVARVRGTAVVWAHLLETTDASGLIPVGAATDPRGGIALAATISGAGELRWDGVAIPGTSGSGPLVLASVDATGALRFADVHDGLVAGPIAVAPDGTIAACRNAVFGPDGAKRWALEQGAFVATHCLGLAGGGSVFADTTGLIAYDAAGATRWNLALGVTHITALAPMPDGGYVLAGDALDHAVTIDGVSVESFFLLWVSAEGHVAHVVPMNSLGMIGSATAVVGRADGSVLAVVPPTDATQRWLTDWLIAPTDALVLMDVSPEGAVQFATSADLRFLGGKGAMIPPGPFLVPASSGRVLLTGGLGGALDFSHDPTRVREMMASGAFYVMLRP